MSFEMLRSGFPWRQLSKPPSPLSCRSFRYSSRFSCTVCVLHVCWEHHRFTFQTEHSCLPCSLPSAAMLPGYGIVNHIACTCCICGCLWLHSQGCQSIVCVSAAGVATIGLARRDCRRVVEAHLQSLLVCHLYGHPRYADPTGSFCWLDDMFTHPHGHASTQGMSGLPCCMLYTG